MNSSATVYRPARFGNQSLQSLAGSFVLLALLIVGLPFLQLTKADPIPELKLVPVVSLKPPERVIVAPPIAPGPKPSIVPPIILDQPDKPIPVEPSEVRPVLVPPHFVMVGDAPMGTFKTEPVIPEFAAVLDNSPKALTRISPVYPLQEKRYKIEGFAGILLTVDERGRVIEAAVKKASHPNFGKVAVRAVLQWHFEPGIKDGRPVKFRLLQQFTFRLD